eukprot:scaffold60268_cov27-Tisochrysis_lutea.AAC.2
MLPEVTEISGNRLATKASRIAAGVLPAWADAPPADGLAPSHLASRAFECTSSTPLFATVPAASLRTGGPSSSSKEIVRSRSSMIADADDFTAGSSSRAAAVPSICPVSTTPFRRAVGLTSLEASLT